MDDLRQLAAEIAAAHDLPAALVQAIVTVESSWEPRATRYEPAFTWLLPDTTLRPRACSRATEESLQKHSWGLMQVMGVIYREQGRAGWITSMLEPEVGLDVGCQHLAGLATRFDRRWADVCAAYNGGRGAVLAPRQYRNPEYPAKVLAAMGGFWPEA